MCAVAPAAVRDWRSLAAPPRCPWSPRSPPRRCWTWRRSSGVRQGRVACAWGAGAAVVVAAYDRSSTGRVRWRVGIGTQPQMRTGACYLTPGARPRLRSAWRRWGVCVSSRPLDALGHSGTGSSAQAQHPARSHAHNGGALRAHHRPAVTGLGTCLRGCGARARVVPARRGVRPVCPSDTAAVNCPCKRRNSTLAAACAPSGSCMRRHATKTVRRTRMRRRSTCRRAREADTGRSWGGADQRHHDNTSSQRRHCQATTRSAAHLAVPTRL